MATKTLPHKFSSVANEHTEKLILDGTKIGWHLDRIKAWERGEKFAPITVDMALTRACNYACHFCYAMLQENDRSRITTEVMNSFLEDCAEIGVKGISFVSDGESTLSPAFIPSVQKGSNLGISMACGTNGFLLNKPKLEQILPHLTYLRINFSAGTRDRYAEIMGVKPEWFDRVIDNVREMIAIKRHSNLPVTIGLQMVLMPEDKDQILPFAQLGKDLRPDYAVIKHCTDNESGDLGVNYDKYAETHDLLAKAEDLSDESYLVVVKWSKIKAEGKRIYQRCYGAPFILQISGSGLVAPCGWAFNDRYKKLHIGNIADDSFKDLIHGDRYWSVMRYLASPDFNAQKMCASACLQDKVNETLDSYKKGRIDLLPSSGPQPQHINFI